MIPRTPASALSITQMLAPVTNPNIPNQPLHPTGPLYITVHETGNESPGAGALFHANYVGRDKGGIGRVSFHFTVDKTGAYQMVPMDRNAWHAGDGCNNYEGDLGCFASVAIETCVNDPINSDGWQKTLGNLHALLCAILTGDPRIAWGKVNAGRFSAERIRPHHRFSDDKKWCPTRMLNARIMDPGTGNGPLVQAVRETLGQAPEPPVASYARPVETPPWEGRDVQIGSNVWRAIRRKVTVSESVSPKAFFAPGAPSAGPDLGAGAVLDVEWHVTTGSGLACWVTRQGHRVDAKKVKEKLTWG